MSRVTAPSKLARSINSAATAGRGRFDAHNSHGAVLMPKYAELLNRKTPEVDSQHARGIKTTHRPTPQPVPSASARRPLMQTFSPTATASSASSSFSTTAPSYSSSSSSNMAATVMPTLASDALSGSDFSGMRMPLLPDSFATRHAQAETPDAPLAGPEISIVSAAADVSPASALTEVEGIGIDGVELRFAHEPEEPSGSEAQEGHGMLRDLWRGLVEDVTGKAPKAA